MHLGVLTMFVGTGACILVHGSQHVIYHGVLIVDWQAIYIMPVMYISSDVVVMYIVVCGIQCLSAPAHASRHAHYYGILSLSAPAHASRHANYYGIRSISAPAHASRYGNDME